MKISTSPQQWEELIRKGFNLDTIFLLKLIDEQFDINPLCENSMKISSTYQSLLRKALITSEDKLTNLGKDLIAFVDTKDSRRILKRKPTTTDFEEWWKIYPGTDSFEYKGKKFKGTRAIKKGKDECRLKFDKILLEGDYTAAQLIDALSYEIKQKMETSINTNTNRMTFMQGSIPYLNQRAFEPFIELIKEGVKVEEAPDTSGGGTDI